jgi:hypothetical protein
MARMAAAVGLSTVILTSCGSPAPNAVGVTSKGAEVGFWAGENVVNPHDVPMGQTYWLPRDTHELTPAVWSVLSRYHAPLYLDLDYKRDFGPIPPGEPHYTDGLRIVQEANRLHVPVVAWILLPFSDGLWSDEANAQESATATLDLFKWAHEHRLTFRQVVLDQEMSYQTTSAFTSAISNSAAMATLMRQHLNLKLQCLAVQTYRHLISKVHANGDKISETPVPFALNDLFDNRIALQDALGVSAFPPLGYNDIYLQAYRSEVAQSAADPGSGWVATYFEEMQHYFGPIGQITLGVAGSAPYDQLSVLASDVSMLAGMGATQIPIFSLESTVDHFGATGVKALIQAGREPMTNSRLAKATSSTSPIAGVYNTLFSNLDKQAVALTPSANGGNGANSYPNGCGSPKAS